jgi:hypothetical protein
VLNLNRENREAESRLTIQRIAQGCRKREVVRSVPLFDSPAECIRIIQNFSQTQTSIGSPTFRLFAIHSESKAEGHGHSRQARLQQKSLFIPLLVTQMQHIFHAKGKSTPELLDSGTSFVSLHISAKKGGNQRTYSLTTEK